MSLRRLLDRRVTIVHRAVTGTNGRGSDVVGETGRTDNVRAARDLESETEKTDVSTEQTDTRFVYFFDRGTVLGELDAIVDADGIFEIYGKPERISRRLNGREHHVEVVAYRNIG